MLLLLHMHDTHDDGSACYKINRKEG